MKTFKTWVVKGLLGFHLGQVEWCRRYLDKKSGKAIKMAGFFKVQSVDEGER